MSVECRLHRTRRNTSPRNIMMAHQQQSIGDDFDTIAAERRVQQEWVQRLGQTAKQDLFGVIRFDSSATIRSLYSTEVRTLQTVCRCRCQDWTRLRLLLPTGQHRLDQSARFANFVSDTTFGGTVVFILRPLPTPS